MAETIILSGFPKPQKDYYKVYVCTITFNQASYIGDCLNGVAIQQTDFPFVHHVIDDCSTDGEQEVIKTYLNNNCDMDNAEYYDNDVCSITIAKNRFNPNCTLVVYFLKKNMYRNPEKRKLLKTWRDVSLYEAICEGDDYWIVSNKLQMQADYMDTHDYCTLCCHAHLDRKDDNFMENHRYSINNEDCPMSDVISIGGSFVATNSMFIRNSQFSEKPVWFYKSPIVDLVIMYLLGSRGKIAYLNEIMSVYRIASSNSWSERMRKSWSERNEYFVRDIKVHEDFDKWTNYKYHDCIVKKIRLIKKIRFHANKSQIKSSIKKIFKI